MPEPVTMTILAVTVVSVAVMGYKTVEVLAKAPVETAKAAKEIIQLCSDELHKLFGARPRWSIDQEVAIKSDPVAICEFCLAKAEVEVSAKIHNEWMGSTKRFSVSESFILKAGYDLSLLKFDFDSRKKVMRVTISEATIVNVIQKGSLKMEENDGWWNKLSAADRAAAINSLPTKAKGEAKRSGVYSLAEKELKLVLEQMFKALVLSVSVEVVCLDDAIAFEDQPALREISHEARKKLGLVEAVTLAPNKSNIGTHC